MIVINNQLAKEVIANALASKRVNENSNSSAYLIQASIHLHEVYDKTNHREDRLTQYSEKEFAAAEAIHWIIAYLEKLKCANIEQLLKDVAAYRAAHPDLPRGRWPY